MRFQGLSEESRDEVVEQRRPSPHGKDPGFWARVLDPMGTITGRKYTGMVYNLIGGFHLDKPLSITWEWCLFREPGSPCRAGTPKAVIEWNLPLWVVVGCRYVEGARSILSIDYAFHRRVQMDLDLSFAQYSRHNSLYVGIGVF
jgi:hypothetical protein